MKSNPERLGCKFREMFCAATDFCYKVLPYTKVVSTKKEGKKVIDSKIIIIEPITNKNTKKYVMGVIIFLLYPGC